MTQCSMMNVRRLTDSEILVDHTVEDEYNILHPLYETAKRRFLNVALEAGVASMEELENWSILKVKRLTRQRVLDLVTLKKLAKEFRNIQQAFLRNRVNRTPPEIYRQIAGFLDCRSRTRLARCGHFFHDEVIYGGCDGRNILQESYRVLCFNSSKTMWQQGGVLERVYNRRYPFSEDMTDYVNVKSTPLLHACRCDAPLHIIRLFIEAKAELECVVDGKGQLALSYTRREDVIDMLIAAGADVNVLNHHDSPSVIRRLLAARADPTARLRRTLFDGNRDMLSLLIEEKANLNTVDEYGITPLGHAIDKDSDATCIVELLLQANADPNVADDDGTTPLMHAFHYCSFNLSIIFALLRAGANVNIVNHEGASVIDLATRRLNREDEFMNAQLDAGEEAIHDDERRYIEELYNNVELHHNLLTTFQEFSAIQHTGG